MLENHLVSELLCWKVEFSQSLTAWWYISNKPNRSYFGDDPMTTRATEGSSKTEGLELNWSPATQAFMLRKHIKQENVHKQVYLNLRASTALFTFNM